MKRQIAIAFLCMLVAGCATQAPKVSLPPAPPAGEPGNIAGLTAAQIRTAFGEPAFVRKDNGSEIWRYDGGACKAFFFFFAAANSVLTVKHVETLPRGSAIAADSSCLASLQVQKTVPAS